MKGEVICIEAKTAKEFLLPRHYSGRIPSISWAYGWYINHELVAVLTIGKPASNNLCVGVCGAAYSDRVYELNRLCRIDGLQLPLSSFVGACLRSARTDHIILVSYSDTDMAHHGYIYQACNFLYTGMTKERTDKYTEGNKHSRHYSNDEQNGLRKVRSAKHRYVMFCTSRKHLKKEWRANLKYPILPYPKGDNSNYVLGEYLQPKIIEAKPHLDALKKIIEEE